MALKRKKKKLSEIKPNKMVTQNLYQLETLNLIAIKINNQRKLVKRIQTKTLKFKMTNVSKNNNQPYFYARVKTRIIIRKFKTSSVLNSYFFVLDDQVNFVPKIQSNQNA